MKKLSCLTIIAALMLPMSPLFAAEVTPQPILSQPAEAIDTLVVTAIHTDKDGYSFFVTKTFPLKAEQSANSAYHLGSLSDKFAPGTVVYRASKVNLNKAGWHVAPVENGRLIVYLSGKYRITVGNPDNPISQEFKGGDILYFSDTTGVGHITEVLEDGATILYDFLDPVPELAN